MRSLRVAMLAATLLPLSSHAGLGGAPNLGAASATMLRATPQSAVATATPQTALAAQPASAASTAPYTVRQSLDANGVTTREYVLPSNVVFAVTWEGPIRPDMTALLGNYFPNYVSAGQSRTLGSGPLSSGDGTFRIESGGRLGHFYGIAWLPHLIPAGIRPGDLQ
ncbi:hypothetical protein LMG28614_06085 [Paraburkholderia ultramafica]|uniref:DUF2844 domain-containing protein n=1 Tax=Paraburkholderia ultramafica TaxID=1544867 RepID=A0A6S7BLQ1_9BURK|nr:DUF2844 domain-containing protein [Paraburkholderia ultramafica]CAB3804812.1 hypothetical protein LMG28614_06085 [Paraburkholderia ultramafica]